MKNRAIFLTGFMGTGKSASGKQAAFALKYSFIDTDRLVEKSLGKSVSDIFRQDGEEVFRHEERLVLQGLLKGGPFIVSTGGGAVCYGDNLKFMKSAGLVLSLLASPETIYKRIVASPNERPLLTCDNPMSHISRLVKKRAYYYINADFLIDTEDKSVAEVASEIVRIAENGRCWA